MPFRGGQRGNHECPGPINADGLADLNPLAIVFVCVAEEMCPDPVLPTGERLGELRNSEGSRAVEDPSWRRVGCEDVRVSREGRVHKGREVSGFALPFAPRPGNFSET